MANRETIAKYAPIVFWAGVIVMLLAVIVIASTVVMGSGKGPVPPEYMIAGGLVLVAISGLMNPNAVRSALGVRTVRYGGNSLIITIAFLAILGVLNYLGTQPRFDYRKDFSANQQFTISAQTAQILQTRKQPVKATAFFSPAAAGGRVEAEDRLKEYQLRGGDKFTYAFVDPEQRPDLANSLGLTHDGGVVFESGAKKQEAISSSEQDFTTAILKVTTDTPHTIVFMSGHKERDVAATDPTGLSNIKQALEKDNYTVTSVNTLLTTTLPASTTVLVIASPQITLTAPETAMLSDYLDRGGRLLVMSDAAQPIPAPDVLAKWGVTFDNDEAWDPAKYLQGTSPIAPASDAYPFSTITQKMNGAITIFPLARSLQQSAPPTSTLTIQPIVQTTAQSWGETNLDPSVPPAFDAKDVKGPLNLGLSVEGTAPVSSTNSSGKTRIVVYGSAHFIANDVLQSQGLQGVIANVDLFTNSVNWLAEDESLISIRATPPTQRTVAMTAQQQSLVFLLSVVIVPALVFIGGFSVWWRRR